MPSASPIPKIMFVTKTESSKAWPTSAVSAERDDDREERQDERDHAGDDRAEDEQQDDQRGRRAEEELALLQVLLGELREVLVDRELPGHRRLDTGLLVEALDGGDDVLKPVLVAPRPTSRAAALPSSESQPLLAFVRDDDGRRPRPAEAPRRATARVAVPTSPGAKLTMTTSLVARSAGLRRGGKCSTTSSSARFESVGEVTSPSVVSVSPSSTRRCRGRDDRLRAPEADRPPGMAAREATGERFGRETHGGSGGEVSTHSQRGQTTVRL